MVEKVPKGYKKTEIGVIPEDWKVKKLKDLSSMKSGEAITSKFINMAGNYPCYGGNGLRGFTSRFTHKGEYALIGRQGALCGNVQYVNGAFFASEHAVVVTPEMDIDIKWLSFVLKDMNLNQYSESSAQPGLSVTKILELSVAAPVLKSEQAAIAEALSDMDNLIASFEKMIAKKQSIKQGTMQELLTEKKRLSGFSSKWEERTLGEICEIKDGTHQTPKYVYSGIPFYSVENVTQNDFVNTKYISEQEHSKLTKSYKIEKGDILMTRIGSIGDCKYVDWDVNASFYVSLALLKVKKGFNGRFISQYSYSDFFKKEIELNSLQSAIPKKINLGQISNVRLIIPKCEEEQDAIAQVLSDMDEEIKKLTVKLNKYKAIKQGMMQELLSGKRRLV